MDVVMYTVMIEFTKTFVVECSVGNVREIENSKVHLDLTIPELLLPVTRMNVVF